MCENNIGISISEDEKAFDLEVAVMSLQGTLGDRAKIFELEKQEIKINTIKRVGEYVV